MVTVLIVILYFGILLYAGLRQKSGEKTPLDFLIAGRQVTFFPFLATMVSTSYGWILGVGQLYYEFGISAWLFLSLPYSAFAVILALFFARRARKGKYITLTDLLKRHYGKKVANVGTVFLILKSSPATYILMAGQVLHFIFGWQMAWSIILVTLFSTLYLYKGGFRSVVRTDVLQWIWMYGSFGFLAILLIYRYGWESIQQLPTEYITMEANYSGWYILSWFVLAAITLVDPNNYQRIYSVSHPKVAERGLLAAVGFWTLFDFCAAIIALYGISQYADLDPRFVYLAVGQAELGPLMAGLFMAGVLAAVMSTSDSYIFYSSVGLAKDIFHANNIFKKIPVEQLSRYCILLISFSAVIIALFYRGKTVVDLFFDLSPLVTAVLLVPVISAHYSILRLPSYWVLMQMLVSLGVTVLYQLSQDWLTELYPVFEELNSVYFGVATSILLQLVGMIIYKVGNTHKS